MSYAGAEQLPRLWRRKPGHFCVYEVPIPRHADAFCWGNTGPSLSITPEANKLRMSRKDVVKGLLPRNLNRPLAHT